MLSCDSLYILVTTHHIKIVTVERAIVNLQNMYQFLGNLKNLKIDSAPQNDNPLKNTE